MTMELNREFTIEELSHEFIPHWHFSSHKHDNKELINKFINILNIQSLDLNWNGCFGATCIISLTKIIELENKDIKINKIGCENSRKIKAFVLYLIITDY
jgi:hypothetical protein